MNVSADDYEVVALTLYGEARGCHVLDRLGVLAVIRERYLRPGWWSKPGHTWADVCRFPWAFSAWHSHDDAHRRNHEAMMRAKEVDKATFEACFSLAEYAINAMKDRDVATIFNASGPDDIPTHYHDRSIDTPKAWGEKVKEIVPPWKSAFRWYVVYEGRPRRRGA